MSHDALAKLDFTCTQEQYPELPAEADILYRYALYHDLHNRKRPSQRKNVLDYLHYYRIAAANGHWRANLTLQKHLAANDAIEVENSLNEGIAYNLLLEDALPATADLWWSRYILAGYDPSHEKGDSTAYLRRAAERGNAEAQYMMGGLLDAVKNELYTDDPRYWKIMVIAEKFYYCSASAGHRFASPEGAMQAKLAYQNDADTLITKWEGKKPKSDKTVAELDQLSLQALQQGMKAGGGSAAYALRAAFDPDYRHPNAPPRYTTVTPDAERAKRYRKIGYYIDSRLEFMPEMTVEDLDDIVPLPPAPLPAWDGTIAFQRFYDGESPAKPSDELMKKLAAAKGLDPATGLPVKKDGLPAVRSWQNWWD
ncbi:hypothetical protein KCG54_06650 [Neisseria subflava]|uniref:DUF6396 domain-containing protein n=1 Tax=Neisseria subflava TaxID=28449 RepID=A0A9X9HSG5_NEISU|nr:DUF6396 domain-containing protein [Neisseria subflava]UTG68918.1 hypothetical protein KCG54_06650 [Neisseria subflava]